MLFGQAGGSRLEIGEVILAVAAELQNAGGSAQGAVGISGTLNGGKVVIDASRGDGFLAKIFPRRTSRQTSRCSWACRHSAASTSAAAARSKSGCRCTSTSGRLDRGADAHGRAADGRMPLERGRRHPGAARPARAVVQNMGVTRDALSSRRTTTATSARRSSTSASSRRTASGCRVDAGAIKGGGFLCARRRQGRVLRRARAVVPGHLLAQGRRHHQHEDAGRQQGLRAADPGHRRVHADPARLRLHARSASAACSALNRTLDIEALRRASAPARSTASCSRRTSSRTSRASSAT